MKRIATLFVFIFLFSTFSNQVNGILNPEFDADQSSGRQMASSFVEMTVGFDKITIRCRIGFQFTLKTLDQ